MSSKGQVVSPQQAATTPRRLRSGTHYGDQKNQHPAPPKKDGKKTSKESSQASDSGTTSKGDRAKTSKHTSINHDEKALNRPAVHSSSTSVTSSSPKQVPKCQTLKAILESIEPNIALKSKHSKRKTLRDLLDKKMFKDKKDQDQKVAPKEPGKQSIKSEKDANGGENHHRSKTCKANVSPKATKLDCKPKQETSSPRRNTAHTQTTTPAGSLAKVKEEPPDDYWAMKLNYAENSTARNSVELRIKAGSHAGHSDDHSQTFRISCSRPETADNSPTALHRNLKPDIVLKVRPRSSSLSALNRSVLDSKRSMGTYKTTGKFHSRFESQSTIFSTISPLSFKSKSSLQSDYESNYVCGRGTKYRYHCSNSSLHIPGAVLRDSSPVLNRHGNISAAKSLNFDQVNHEDVVEESKLPPVANTVELLSEPHDYHYNNNADAPFQLADYSASPCSSQPVAGYADHDKNSPGPPVLEPMTVIKAEPRQAEEKEERTHDRNSFELVKEEEVPLWGKQDYGEVCVNKALCQREYLGRDSKCVVSAFHRLEKEEAEEEEEEEEEEECSRPEDGGREAGARQALERLPGKSRDRREPRSGSVEVSSIPDESGSRRRRKGRPSRRAKTERRWQTADLCLSPQEDEEGGGPAGWEEKDCPGKSTSRTSSNAVFNTRKGGKRQGEAGSGGRRARKSLDLETLWANPELDTHAFLLWASENRSEVQKQNPEVSVPEVEGLLASQWRQLPFSGKLQFLCRARDAGTDHNKHTVRKKKVPVQKKDPAPSDGRSVYEEFLRLPQERQKDLLRKWLRFFQKMLPRLEYQDFISDFKKACKSLQLRPVPARRKNARLRNLDPSHYHMLFEKIRQTRPRVISAYNKRKAREEQLLRQSFGAMIRRLIARQPWPFVRGCRSKMLGELLKDIQQLEVEEVLAQIDLPLPLTSTDLSDPFLSKDLQDPADLSAADVASESSPADLVQCPAGGHSVGKEAHPRKGPSGGPSSAAPCSSLALSGGPAGDAELPDSPFVLNVLDGLRHASDLPVLDQRCLDSVFLGPPTRSRSQTSRDSQFQNSATYRRTLLYKHIQPLLDARGMPLPSSSLYHSHSAQYFYPDDR